jgi:hypothetical protein
MATKKPRITITLEATSAQLLLELAKQKQQSVSRIAKELILQELAHQEYRYFSMLADTRDKENTPRISHKDAWK